MTLMKVCEAATATPDSVPVVPKQAVIGFLTGFSLETTPAIAAKVPSFSDLLPAGTSVYIAMLPGGDHRDNVATARRLRAEGMNPVPHIPARSLKNRAQLEDYLARAAGEAGVDQVLVIGGGVNRPVGEFHSSMQVLETGLLDACGIVRVGVAGHPEGSPDIPAGDVWQAVADKNAFAERSDAAFYIATQFCFDADAILRWDQQLRAAGSTLPVHIGVAGPAKLSSLMNYARMCGVGASMRVLTRQTKNLARLSATSMPDRLITQLAMHQATHPETTIVKAHFYAFGGLAKTARWLVAMSQGRFTMDRNALGWRYDAEF